MACSWSHPIKEKVQGVSRAYSRWDRFSFPEKIEVNCLIFMEVSRQDCDVHSALRAPDHFFGHDLFISLGNDHLWTSSQIPVCMETVVPVLNSSPVVSDVLC